MNNLLGFGITGIVAYGLLFVATGGNSSRAFHLISLLTENWLNTGIAALQSLPFI